MSSSTGSRWGLRVVGLGYLTLLLLLPLGLIFYKTFEQGISPPLEAITERLVPALARIEQEARVVIAPRERPQQLAYVAPAAGRHLGGSAGVDPDDGAIAHPVREGIQRCGLD